MSNRDDLRWRLACAMYETRPPYVREENERVLLPGSNNYINDVLREVWHSAFREVLDILDDCEEPTGPKGPQGESGCTHDGEMTVEHTIADGSTPEDIRCTCCERFNDAAHFYQHIFHQHSAPQAQQ